MKIYRWLGNAMSERLGLAIVEVEPDEPADIDKMLVLVDGGNTGHFGIHVRMLSTEQPPKIVPSRNGGWPHGGVQFGFPPYKVALKQTRYYEVHVSRD